MKFNLLYLLFGLKENAKFCYLYSKIDIFMILKKVFRQSRQTYKTNVRRKYIVWVFLKSNFPRIV